MSGLESILEKITEDANTSAQARIKRAEEDANAYLSRKREEAAAEAEQLIAAEEESLELFAAKSRSSAESEAKKRLLRERVVLIDEVLQRARERVISLPVDERFVMIERFVRSHASELTDGCELILNARDIASVPKNFSERLASIFSGGIRISEHPGHFEAGCILKCGFIEYNGTVDAVINDRLDEIRDLINQHLFDEIKPLQA
ncbi:MAG: V-type ATP synthase subunit E [Clostridiales bacterium]|nr:V-type ATP synthase subunit E [Clostridiales bacterium]